MQFSMNWRKGNSVKFYSCFQNNSYCIIKKGRVLTWQIFHLFGNLSDMNWLTTVSLVYHLSILRFFQLNKSSRVWGFLRSRIGSPYCMCCFTVYTVYSLHCTRICWQMLRVFFNFWNRHHALEKRFMSVHQLFLLFISPQNFNFVKTFLPPISYDISCISIVKFCIYVSSLHSQLCKNIWFVDFWQKCYELYSFDCEMVQIC